jgi:UDP-2-acetamido-3-amino-2,3-dideoxy-glucuronate N-acetyltransferase
MSMNMEANHPPSVAVIGMGYWGKHLVRNFHALGALRAVCDSDPERESAVAEIAPGAVFTSDFKSVLEDSAIDALVLSTPAATHYSLGCLALEAGKDLYVEKPLALDVNQGQALVDLAAKKGRVLMVGHILLYHPAVTRLSELVAAGELGTIRYIYSNRLNMGKIRTEENILWSFAPHDISVMLALLNEEPESITCEGGAYLSSDIADVTMSQFIFPSGACGHIHVSWLHPFKEQRLVVVGSDKMAVFDDIAESKLTVYPHKVEWRDTLPTAIKADGEPVAIDDVEPLRAECEHFLQRVLDRQPPRSDGEEGLRVLKVLHACQESLDGRRRQAAPRTDLPYTAHETAIIDDSASIGDGSRIWQFSQVMKGASLGENCVLGQNVNVGQDVAIGNNVKIQNNVSIYTGVTIEDDVFLGPSCVLTNVTNPRSQINRHSLYEKTTIRRGASIGANATIVCGITIGRYAFVAAGAVVTHDIPDYRLVLGNPAKQSGWMSRHGHRLYDPDDDGTFRCPESGYRYAEAEPGILRCLDLDEDSPLPDSHRKGTQAYDSFKS